LLAGEFEPTAGQIVRRDSLAISVAHQTVTGATAPTLFEFVFEALGPLARLRDAICTLEGCLSDPKSATEYACLINDYGEGGGYAAEAAVARILNGLGWREPDHGRDPRTLSGGERSRAELARALSLPSDLLILDEPTNHLDISAREWLDSHLQSRRGAIVFTSHDRALLGSVAARIIEIERGTVRVYESGFAGYREMRARLDRQAWDAYLGFERRRAAVEQAAQSRSALARRVAATPEGTSGVRNPFYAKKAAKVARTGRILRERVNESPVAKPWLEQSIPVLSFEHVVRSGDVVVSARGLTKRYGNQVLFEDLSFALSRGETLVIRGPNGSGKTTLLKLIMGVEQPDSGIVELGLKVQSAVVLQDAMHSDLNRSALDVCGAGTNARTLLACLRLRADRLNRPLRELSGGERTKVALARVLDSGANLLLLDEPTNHLEIEAQEALEEALRQFPGTLIVTSHDRSFIREIGNGAAYLDLGGVE